MKLVLAFALIVGFTAAVQAEYYLDEDADSDVDYGYWRNKFEGGSDKPLGKPKDTAAIKALVPATISPTIRWVSQSIVVVSADCRSPDAWRGRCLYVFEKDGSKWSLTHHYRWPFRDRIAATAQKVEYAEDLSELLVGTIHGICNRIIAQRQTTLR